MVLERIVSGGQTGVDRGALHAALERGFPCGGWCPTGRKAEDGRIADLYPVIELATSSYLSRTRKNVADSDGTLVLYLRVMSGGTLKTVEFCEQTNKPVLALDCSGLLPHEAARRANSFVRRNAIKTLNVAGPRESGAPGAQAYARQVVLALIALQRPSVRSRQAQAKGPPG